MRRFARPHDHRPLGVDTILAGAGLTVHGAGFLSYPGEGLIKDGLSYVANAIHNI